MAGLGITVPSLLATPVSVVVTLYFCTAGYNWLDNDITCLAEGIGIWCACGLAFVTWMAPLLMRGFKVNRSSEILLKPFEELFIQQTWNGIFLEQHLSLNYKPDGFSSTSHIPTNSNRKATPTKIFICTTMYREANFEMGRLLKSLYKISQSTKLKNICFEAHIFLDNGAQETHLTEFASQLISLLQPKMQISARDATAYVTPYGVQLNWTLEGGMPFFIHLKDVGKVKAKKRWSQIMYMSYVLNYRVPKNCASGAVHFKAEGTEHIDDSLFVGYASDTEWNKNTLTLSSSSDGKTEGKKAYFSSLPQLETPQFMQDNRRRMSHMFSGPLLEGPGATTESCGNISIIGVMQNQQKFQQQVSSDQGIGGSDDVSSSVSMQNEQESSETGDSSSSSMRRTTEGGDEEEYSDLYEGDISSNYENSLSSGKARRITARARDHAMYEKGKCLEGCKQYRTVPPPRHKQHRTKWEQKNAGSQKVQLLSHKTCTTSDTSAKGIDNPAFQNDMPQTSKESAVPQENTKVFVISPKVLPHGQLESQAAVDINDQTYILATDADMEFEDESVLQLLTLCNNDRRIGGACGRTHPVGQRSSPLVWYQMFEYAKG